MGKRARERGREIRERERDGLRERERGRREKEKRAYGYRRIPRIWHLTRAAV